MPSLSPTRNPEPSAVSLWSSIRHWSHLYASHAAAHRAVDRDCATDECLCTLYTTLAQLTARSARGISPCHHAEQSSSSSPAISYNRQADRPTTLRMRTYIHNRLLAVHWKFLTVIPISDVKIGRLVGHQDAPVWYGLSSRSIWTSPRSRGGCVMSSSGKQWDVIVRKDHTRSCNKVLSSSECKSLQGRPICR